MRLLLEILIIGALVYLGWETPFRDRFPASTSGVAKSKSNATGTSQPINASAAPHQPTARSTPTPSGAWMWDPSHRSALDRPTPKQTRRNANLLVNSFELLIDHFSRETINRNVQPVSLFTFDNKLRESSRSPWITP
jgi:hypothetical protein